jgi:drug/metabolite transporter (DMT)-like permease
VAVALGWLILDESITAQMAIAGGAVLVSVAVILRSGGASLEPGRGLFTRQRQIAAAAATEPTA